MEMQIHIPDPISLFIEDFHLKDEQNVFLADVDFAFNATRKICECTVKIEVYNEFCFIRIFSQSCDPQTYPLSFNGREQKFLYDPLNCLEIHGKYKNPIIGKYKVIIKPKETTW